MATEKIGVEIDINTNDLDKLKIGLEAAEKEAEKLKKEFGEGSEEFKKAANTAEAFKKKVSEVGEQSKKSVGSLKSQIKEANLELIKAQEQFGDYSKEAINAAKKVAALKDKVKEAAETADLFNPEKKFQVFAGALSSVAGGFSAVQGALGLVGVESENVQKSLLKVQSALALSQGLSTIANSAESFNRLKSIVGTGLVNAFKSLKAAIGSTGIGLLVVALGSIVAYWEEIKTLIGGVSSEQKKLAEDSKKNAVAEKEKLDAIGEQENILKQQGKSEREILELKIKQIDAAIKAQEVSIEAEKTNKKLAVEAAERNKKYLKGFIEFVTLPIQLLFKLGTNAINGLIGLINKIPGVNIDFRVNDKLLEEGTDALAGLLFDPKKTAEEGDATIKEAEKSLTALKNQKAGFQNQIASIDKAAGDKAATARKERDAAELEAAKKLADIKKELDLSSIKDEFKRRKKELEFQLSDEINLVEANAKLSEETKQKLIAAIKDKYTQLNNANEEAKLKADEEKRKAELQKIAEFEKQSNDIKETLRINAIQDEVQKALENVRYKYQKQREQILAEENLTAEQIIARDKLLAELRVQQAVDETIAIKEAKKKQLGEDVAKLEGIANDPEQEFAARQEALAKETQLVEDAFNQKIITEEEYLAKRKDIADAEKKLEEEKIKSTIATADAIAGTLGGLANLFGKNTRAGKVFAIAEATISTFTAAQKAFAAAQSIPPPVGQILGAANAAVAVATGIKNIREITKVKIPGGDGGSAPSISAPAPIAPPVPQVATTKLDNQTINKIGQASRSYVLESDVTDSQEKQRRINRAARLS
jgi:hypothetical protein